MGRCKLTRGRQALELRSNLSERRTLTDRIQAPECPVMASTRNLQWSIAHGEIISITATIYAIRLLHKACLCRFHLYNSVHHGFTSANSKARKFLPLTVQYMWYRKFVYGYLKLALNVQLYAYFMSVSNQH